jgi:hypothetical protein
MVMGIRYLDYFSKKTGKDVFFLQLTAAIDSLNKFDEQTLTEHTTWLDANSVHYEMVCSIGHMCGNTGAYYMDFSGWYDPKLKEYCKIFEDDAGKSKDPSKYRICYIDYNNWVSNGGSKAYEQHLLNLADPEYQY